MVPDSKTTAEIQKESGGALGALEEKVLWAYLKGHNPRSDEQKLVILIDYPRCFNFLFTIFFIFFVGKTNLYSFLCCFLCDFICDGNWRPAQ